jgi:hypothetical protein
MLYHGDTMNGTARWIALTSALCLAAVSARAFPIDPYGAQAVARTIPGQPVPGHAPCMAGAFCDVNQDSTALFTSQSNPTMIIDDTVFFGILTDSTRSRDGAVAGAAAGITTTFALTPGGAASPEPGATALLAAGFALLGLRARRS